MNGKRYQKAKKSAKVQEFDFSKYAPNIVKHRVEEGKLYCHLTKKIINMIPDEVFT